MEAKIIMLKGEKGEPGGSTWGNISGTLSSQTDLNSALNGKADTLGHGAVAFSNDYDDLNGKPTIPTKTSDLTNDSEFIDQSDLQNLLVDLVYPVGSYCWSSNNTNPGTIFGGTWEQIKDKFKSVVHLRVIRPNLKTTLTKEQQCHPSETALDGFPADDYIHNDSSLKMLRQKVNSWCDVVLYKEKIWRN